MKTEPKWSVARAVTVLAAGVLTASTVTVRAESADTLDGWAGLRFGMTVDEARSVADRTWAEPEKANVRTAEGKTVAWTILKSARQVAFAGQAFDLEADFDEKGSLNQIKLSRREPVDAFAACDGAFRKMLAEGERQFGPFRPAQAEKAEGRDAELERETKTSDWILAIAHHRVAEGRSTYEVRTDKWRKTSEKPWHVYNIANAIRPFSASYVELIATLAPNEPCQLALGFASGPYPSEK